MTDITKMYVVCKNQDEVYELAFAFAATVGDAIGSVKTHQADHGIIVTDGANLGIEIYFLAGEHPLNLTGSDRRYCVIMHADKFAEKYIAKKED